MMDIEKSLAQVEAAVNNLKSIGEPVTLATIARASGILKSELIRSSELYRIVELASHADSIQRSQASWDQRFPIIFRELEELEIDVIQRRPSWDHGFIYIRRTEVRCRSRRCHGNVFDLESNIREMIEVRQTETRVKLLCSDERYSLPDECGNRIVCDIRIVMKN